MVGDAAAKTTAEADLGVTLPKGDVTPGIRQSIEAAIDQAVPQQATWAIVAVADKEKGLQLGLACRFRKGWELDAQVDRQWSGAVNGKVVVMRSW